MDKAEAGQQSFLSRQVGTGPKPARPLKHDDDLVFRIMYTFFAPLVVWPGSEDDFKDKKLEISLHRFKQQREIFEQEVCSEFDAMLYISTATLAAPLAHGWFNIYMYLFRRCMPEKTADAVGADVMKLEGSEKEDLERLRRWIYKQQVQHLKARLKEKPESADTEPEAVQGKFF